VQDETSEESGEDMAARQLGLEMVYHLFTLQHVDQLLEYHKKGNSHLWASYDHVWLPGPL
jgi:hypothetical protein